MARDVSSPIAHWYPKIQQTCFSTPFSFRLCHVSIYCFLWAAAPFFYTASSLSFSSRRLSNVSEWKKYFLCFSNFCLMLRCLGSIFSFLAPFSSKMRCFLSCSCRFLLLSVRICCFLAAVWNIGCNQCPCFRGSVAVAMVPELKMIGWAFLLGAEFDLSYWRLVLHVTLLFWRFLRIQGRVYRQLQICHILCVM